MGDLKFLRKLRGYDVRFAALCTARSYEQLASLNAPEAVIALVDRQEAVPLNWT